LHHTDEGNILVTRRIVFAFVSISGRVKLLDSYYVQNKEPEPAKHEAGRLKGLRYSLTLPFSARVTGRK
jgi:hypothetical protein